MIQNRGARVEFSTIQYQYDVTYHDEYDTTDEFDTSKFHAYMKNRGFHNIKIHRKKHEGRISGIIDISYTKSTSPLDGLDAIGGLLRNAYAWKNPISMIAGKPHKPSKLGNLFKWCGDKNYKTQTKCLSDGCSKNGFDQYFYIDKEGNRIFNIGPFCPEHGAQVYESGLTKSKSTHRGVEPWFGGYRGLLVYSKAERSGFATR